MLVMIASGLALVAAVAAALAAHALRPRRALRPPPHRSPGVQGLAAHVGRLSGVGAVRPAVRSRHRAVNL